MSKPHVWIGSIVVDGERADTLSLRRELSALARKYAALSVRTQIGCKPCRGQGYVTARRQGCVGTTKVCEACSGTGQVQVPS